MANVYKIHSFSMESSPENEELVKDLKILAAKDGWNFSRIVKEALAEYVKRHSPGNPQLVLRHWTQDEPLPQTIEHKHSWHGTSKGIVCDSCGELYKTIIVTLSSEGYV